MDFKHAQTSDQPTPTPTPTPTPRSRPRPRHAHAHVTPTPTPKPPDQPFLSTSLHQKCSFIIACHRLDDFLPFTSFHTNKHTDPTRGRHGRRRVPSSHRGPCQEVLCVLIAHAPSENAPLSTSLVLFPSLLFSFQLLFFTLY